MCSHWCLRSVSLVVVSWCFGRVSLNTWRTEKENKDKNDLQFLPLDLCLGLTQAVYNPVLAFTSCSSEPADGQPEVNNRSFSQAFPEHASSTGHTCSLLDAPVYTGPFKKPLSPRMCLFPTPSSSGFLICLLLVPALYFAPAALASVFAFICFQQKPLGKLPQLWECPKSGETKASSCICP